MKKLVILGSIIFCIFLVSILNMTVISAETACVDFTDPTTWAGKIELSSYGYYIVKDDVLLCNKTYNFSSGQFIQIGYPYHSAVDIFDCNGATIIGGGKIEGTGPLISVTCNLSAPYLPCYANLTVKNCKLQNADSGIIINHANHTTLENNEVTNTNYGTMIWGAEDCKVKNSISSNNTYYGFSVKDDIGSRNSKRCLVENNTTENNGHYGIILSSADEGIITQNTIRANVQNGIFVYDSNNNLIYNNYFENQFNSYCHSNSLNNWNINPTSGLNIINGPSLGGNFWNDYSGNDINLDGFGDNPYSIFGGCNDIDNLPLVAYVWLDEDEDGYTADIDCNDNNKTIYPGAVEVCDQIDNNCNGLIDEDDVCDQLDTDGDGVEDLVDNCVFVANSDQKDSDGDGLGDVCDDDNDNDGVFNEIDLCPNTKLPEKFIRLLVNHLGDVDGDLTFETRNKSLDDLVDSQYSLVDTYGCSCVQILEIKPGQNIGEKQFGCTEATIKNFIKKK